MGHEKELESNRGFVCVCVCVWVGGWGDFETEPNDSQINEGTSGLSSCSFR